MTSSVAALHELLGFTKTAGPIGPEPVAILDHRRRN
jgi:hypothetical protein